MTAPVPDAVAVARAVDELDEWVRDYWLGDGDERLQVADLMMKRGHLGTLLAALRSRDAAIAQAVASAIAAENEACYDMVQREDARSLAGVSAHDPLRRIMTAIRARRERVEGGSDDAACE